MIIYRSQVRERDTPGLLDSFSRRLREASSRDDLTDLLISFGEIESALLDSVCDSEDDETELSRRLRRISSTIARAFIASVRGETGRRWLALIPPVLDEVAGSGLPAKVRVSVPEGYAYYALYPEMYLEAARKFRREHGTVAVTTIGIRSIGTSLSAIVAEAVEGKDSWSFTARPRGHPFDRHLQLSPALQAKIARRSGSRFLVVDEGPGLSGSSFAAVSQQLTDLGVDARQIFLFPSWQADPDNFVSQSARRRWELHPKYLASFEEVMPPDGGVDFSAGNWRRAVFAAERNWPAVHPHHERRKYLDNGRLRKFAGLGSYGRERYELARELCARSFVPEVHALENGFVVSEFVDATPLRPEDATGPVLTHIGAYLRCRAAMPAADSTSFDELLEMVSLNSEELLGHPPRELDHWRSVIEQGRACKLDGRMLLHEWLATGGGYLKADAIDHHADHFFPGCVDIAWDVAAACVEWELDASGRAFLIGEMGDCWLQTRLPFYEAAYLAFRGGYASMASASLGESADGRRFRALAGWYSTRLAQTVSALERIAV